MLRFLFWSYCYDGPDREKLLAGLVHEEAIDVLILTESSVIPEDLVKLLSARG